MGKKSKSSRKGKKAWRKNISTEDVEDYLEIATEDALSSGSQHKEPSFFFDKCPELAAKKKIDKARERVLWCDAILQKNPLVKTIPSSVTRKMKSNKDSKLIQSGKDDAALQERLKEENAEDSSVNDLWKEDDGKCESRIKKKFKLPVIPAVEVEPSGCSFNPDSLNHQNALARAVADEMQKVYQQELGPKPVPSVAPEAIDDELKYFLEADLDYDPNEENENQTGNADEEAENRVRKCKRVTRVELNRRAKRKENLKIESEAKKVAELSKSIDELPSILQTIEKEEEEKHNRHMRRTVAKAEKLKVHPPRLGKYKYQPTSLQVLLSEEKTGSLRQLKACCTLVRDRFNSLEKRGLVVPSRRSGR